MEAKGANRAVGLGAYEKYCIPGLYAHGGTSGISRASNDENACRAINHFLRARFPGKTWTSIAILCNPKMGLHRDLLNLRGHSNHAVALGSFTGGRVWVEDENGDAAEEVNMKTKVRSSDPGTTYMTSRLLSTRGAFIKSNLMKRHLHAADLQVAYK